MSGLRDLGFAFNDKDFSDRILHLEVVGESLDSVSDSEDSDNNLNKKQKIGEQGDATNDNNLECSTNVKVKTFHINSAILAGSSPFFYKLFKNGMKESQERDVTLRIDASEKAALMDLLKFMYSNTLSATSTPDLVGVLMVADKFEVSSCMTYCCDLLLEEPMSLESAILYVELPSSVLVGELAQLLIDEAKKYLLERFADITKRSMTYEKEAMTLPLSAIEVVLEGLKVRSEEDVYDFIVGWGRTRYPIRRERREILTKLVGRFLYFPYLCMSTLREIQDSPDFDSKEVSKLMLESLYLNAGYRYGECNRLQAAIGHSCIKRDYNDLPIKVVQFEAHHFVYLNLTKKECNNLIEMSGDRYSQIFFLGKQSFFLWLEGRFDMIGENYLGLFVVRQKDGDDGVCTFNYELGVMKASSEEEFERIHKIDDCTLKVYERVGLANLFGTPWSNGCEDYNGFFIDGFLHF